jgi:NADH-quinone oxidoreductase subunit L
VYFKVFEGPLELPATAGHHEPSPFALDDGHGHGAGGVDTVHAKQGHEEASHGADMHGGGHGGHDAHGHGPNDGSPMMWMPLLVLCVGAVFAGYLGVFGGEHGGWFHHFVGQATNADMAYIHGLESANPGAHVVGEGEVERISHGAMMGISGAISIVGIAIAAYFYLLNRAAAAKMAVTFAPVVKFLYNKWYWDEIYTALLLRPAWILAHILSYFDRYFIDGLVFIVGFIPQLAGYSLKPTQRGLLQKYAVGMVAGLAAIVIGVIYLLMR